VPPHLRPGYVPSAPKVVDYKGKVHWPTNLDSHRVDDIVQPIELARPISLARPITLTGQAIAAAEPATLESLGIRSRKPILKLTRPITPNTSPVARPTMSVRDLPAKFKNTVRLHLRRRSRGMKKGEAKKQTRRQKKARLLAKRH
jgi:hypothetical protein